MHLSLTNTLPLLTTLLPLTTAQRSFDPKGCPLYEPTAAYNIFSDDPNTTRYLTGPNAITSRALADAANSTEDYLGTEDHLENPHSAKFRRAPFRFEVSKGPGNSVYQDLVVVFSGLPCNGPGPFSFEFNFVPQSAYFEQGQDQINMFRVNTANLGDAPTYASVEPLTGSLVGTFELPPVGSDQPKLLFLNQLVCQNELVLRFGITRYSSQGGIVSYMNSNGMGLRERNGC